MNEKDKSVRLEYKDIYLRPLTVEDVSEKYLSWLNDPEVNEFLEIRYNKHNMEDLRAYVASFEDTADRYLFGVFTAGGEHIGNGTVNDINYNVGTFYIGYLIGEKSHWGGGESIGVCLMLLKHGFDNLGMRKLFCGAYANHIGSRFTLQRIGMVQEAVLKDKNLYKGEPVDTVIYTMDREQWAAAKKKFEI